MLYDCQRFVGEFFPLLSTASLHMYLSTPAFTPTNSQLLITYHKDFQHSVKVLHHGDRPQYWHACLQTIEGDTDIVSSAVFSPPGNSNCQYIASASYDFTVRICDAISGVCPKTLQGHIANISCLVWSPDGKYIAGYHKFLIYLWNADTGESLKTIEVDNDIMSLAFVPKNNNIIASSLGQHIMIYNPHDIPEHDPTLAPKVRFVGHRHTVASISVSPDSAFLVSGSWDTSVRLWNITTLQTIKVLRGHSDFVTSVSFSYDGALIVSGDIGGIICIWNAKNGSQIRKLKGHSSAITSITFSPHDIYILSSSADRTMRLWNTNSGTHHMTLMGHSKEVISASFSPDGAYIVSVSLDCTVKIWDAKTHIQQSSKRKAQDIINITLVISPNGQYVASATADHTIELWDSFKGSYLRMLKGHSGRVYSISFSQNSSQLVSGSADNSVRLWNIFKGTCLCILNGHTDSIKSVKFLGNSHQIVSGSFDTTVKIWDTLTRLHVHTFHEHSDHVYDIAVSSDGALVASAAKDTTICIWDVTSKNLLHILHGHSHVVHTVAFSPDDTALASGSWDNTIQLWDVKTGAKLSILQNDYTELIYYKVHFSQNQKFIIAGSSCVETGLESYDAEYAVDFQCFPIYYMKNGWITSVANQHHICWIPQPYRGRLVGSLSRAALATVPGTMIILDLTMLESHETHQ